MALEVVTANGRYITVDAETNPYLFWALRGGGGGTFGVVTSVIIRVHPKVPVTTSVFSFSTSDQVSAKAFWEGIRAYYEMFIPFTDAGTYSWYVLTNTNGTYQFTMTPFFAPNLTQEAFEKLVAPWFNRLRELGISVTPNTTYHDSYYPAYDSTWGSQVVLNGAGRFSVPANWLVPRRNFEDSARFNATFETIQEYSKTGRTLRGYHISPRNRANVNNAVSLAFREVISFLIISTLLPNDVTTEQLRMATDEMKNVIVPMFRKVAPESEGGGAYLNEGNVDEPLWQEAFYGRSAYPRLLEIKNKHDPTHVFYATTAVGSEAWEVRDGDQGIQTQNGRLCRR